MSLFVYDRPQRGGALYIKGTIRFHDGTPPVRVYHRAASDDLTLARQQATLEEAQIIRDHFGGVDRRAPRWTLAQGIKAYITTQARSSSTHRRLKRILMTVDGDKTMLDDVSQLTVNTLRAAYGDIGDATVAREIIAPLSAVLNFCARQRMCPVPLFDKPKYIARTPDFFYPGEAQAIVDVAAPHLRPLLLFLFGTGARMSEALYLDWKDVKLNASRVTFQPDRTKAQKRRDVILPPCVLAALAGVPHQAGAVFRTQDGRAYEPRDGQGGQIMTAWNTAKHRAGLADLRSGRHLTPHSCRHTYATWHYAIHKDALKLKLDGGWGSVALVERYAHAIDDGYENEILKFLGMRWRSMAA